MEVRQLRYFLSTFRTGSVQAAARENFVTQPAVSIQLKRLEEQLGQELFSRAGRHLVPTSAGRVLATRAEEILSRLAQTERELEGFRNGRRGTLKLAAIDAASVYVLPEVLRQYRAAQPDINIEVVVDGSRALLQRLSAGLVEFAIITLPAHAPGIAIDYLCRDDLVVVAAPGIVSTLNPSLEMLMDVPLITYQEASVTRGLINNVFWKSGLTLRPAMELSSPEAMMKLAEAGLGVSILPRPVVARELMLQTLVELHIPGVLFARDLGLATAADRPLSAMAQVFVEILRAAQPAAQAA